MASRPDPTSPGTAPTQVSTTTLSFACFLSHYKVEAATEARWLQENLEAHLGKRCFLDSDDLSLLTELTSHVRSCGCLLLLQTRNVLTRPWCIVEVWTRNHKP